MDFIFEYWWIFLLLLIPIGIFLGRLSKLEREHTRAMGPAAARLGLVFQEKDPGLPFRAFSLLSRSGGRIRDVSKGEVGGSEMVLLNYTYIYSESVWDEGGDSMIQEVGAVRVAGLKLPAFLLEALKLPAFMLLPKRTSVKGIKFDSHPQFSIKYRLTGADETAIRQLFGSYILEFFQQSRGEYVEWSVECDGQWMVIFNIGVGVDPVAIREDIRRLSGGKPDADDPVDFQEAVMRKHVEETMRILDVFRHST